MTASYPQDSRAGRGYTSREGVHVEEDRGKRIRYRGLVAPEKPADDPSNRDAAHGFPSNELVCVNGTPLRGRSGRGVLCMSSISACSIN